MRRSKNLFVALMIMLLVSMVSLFVVGVLTYIFKWHADKAMIGIIATYVLAGFVGGFTWGRCEKRSYGDEEKTGIGKKAIEALVLSSIFMLLLVGISVFCMKGTFQISTRFLILLSLLICSTFLGRIL